MQSASENDTLDESSKAGMNQHHSTDNRSPWKLLGPTLRFPNNAHHGFFHLGKDHVTFVPWVNFNEHAAIFLA